MHKWAFTSVTRPSARRSTKLQWFAVLSLLLHGCTSSVEVEKIKSSAVKTPVEVHEAAVDDSSIYLAWSEVPKAASYKIIIASDEACAEPLVIMSSSSTSTTVQLKVVANVFVCIEAIDSTGKNIKGASVKGYEVSYKQTEEEPITPPNAPPTVAVSEPAGANDVIATNGSFTIIFDAVDADDHASIDLFVATVQTGCTSGLLGGWTQIATGLSEGSGNSYTWTTSGTEPGMYFVCAKISDGHHAPVFALSPSYLKIDAPPSIALTAPASSVTAPQAGTYSIMFSSSDSDDNASINLYRSTSNSGCSTGLNGWTAITANIPEDTSSSYAWVTNAVTPGSYFICAMISDGINPPVYSVSAGKINIDSLPILSFSSPATAIAQLMGTSITFTWTASDAEGPASIALYYKTSNSGGCTSSGTLLASGLVAGTDTSYTWSSATLPGSGEFYICARISDSTNAPVDVHSVKVTFYNNCTWTGASSTTWSTAGNWTNCGGAAPKFVDRVMIASGPTNQPVVTANASVCQIGLGTGGGGTVTVNAATTLTLYCGTIIDSVTLKGATSTCSNCVFTAATVSDGAVLTLDSGITSNGTITVGTATSAASLFVDKGNRPENEWPRVLSIVTNGPSTANRSRLTLNGIYVTSSYAYGRSSIAVSGNTEIVQFDRLNFGNGVLYWVNNNDVIKFSNCSTNLISDTTWTDVNWSNALSMRSGANSLNYPANCGTSINIVNPSGITYGPWYANDPGALISWPPITHQQCIWKSAPVDDSWNNSANWDNCSARSGVPDANDYAEIPAGSSINPVISTSPVLARFSGGSGGGTLTINAGQTLYMTDMSNTFENNLTIQGATSTCSTCSVQSFTSMVIRNNATLTLRSGIGLRLNDYWNNVTFGSGGTAGHLTTIGGATTAEYPWFAFRSFTMSGTSTARSRLNIDGLRHSGSSNNTVVNLSNYYEVIKFDRFTTPHAHNYLGMSVMGIANCANSLFSDTTWTEHIYSGTPGVNSQNIVVSSSCSSGMPSIDIYGSGPNFGASRELDPYNKISWFVQ
jgi:hypothetical protein